MIRRRTAGTAVGAALLLAAACSSDSTVDPPIVSVATTPTNTTTPTTAAPQVDTTTPQATSPTSAASPTTTSPTTTIVPLDLDTVVVSLTEIANFSETVGLAANPTSGEMWVVEQDGLIKPMTEAGTDVEPVLDITDDTDGSGEQGLLGLAFSPDGSELFINYTDADGHTQIERFSLIDGVTVDLNSRRSVMTIEQPYGNHNGGHLAFGPDGLLYIGTGDGGAADDPERRATDPDSLLGKMLRIDPFSAEPYGVPGDNPFVGVEGTRAEIWMFGLRNPWRYSFDRLTGDLWIGDVGQNELEEIDVARAAEGTGRGAHFGWSAYEGSRRFNEDVEADPHTPPIHEFEHGDDGCSVTGGFVYRGTTIEGLHGAYVFGDYCSGKIWALDSAPGAEVRVVELGNVENLSTFGEDPVTGALYAASANGPVYRLDPA